MIEINKIQDKKTSEIINFNDDDFDVISSSDNFMSNTYRHILENQKPNHILDVGCGNGHFSKFFLENSVKVDGIDGYIPALQRCKEIGFNNCYFTENIDTEDITGISCKYDLIICKDFLEHILFPDKLLEQMTSLLEENGKIFIHVPNHFPLFYRIKFLFTCNLDTQNFFPDKDEWNNPHIRYFTRDGLLKMAAQKGLTLEKDYSLEFFYSAPHTVSLFKGLGLSRILYSLWPNLFTTGFSLLLKKK